MSLFYQTVISIISKPSEKRKDEEILMILAWFINLFKKKAHVFGDVNSEVVKDIIKNCSFETKKKDDLIIRQGDVGDCFYINLRGKVSIYINHKKYDENDNIDEIESTKEENNNNEVSNLESSQSKKKRDKLGNYVTSLGPGEGFGEIALVSDDTRSATIIADETTDLMVVNKVLYARCLQAPTQRKLNEKQNFINKSPFFGNWAPKMKKLLSLCLERDIIPYDSYLVKQGEHADKIFFIINGSAKISVNQFNHPVQYPRLYPLKLPENADAEIISSWIDETSNKSAIKNKNSKLSQYNSQVIKRRSETFAEAEFRMKSKNIEIGILGQGEVIGMCEIIFDMPTYMQSIKCLEDCDVYYIYKRSYDRLIAKRNPSCINKMKENVYYKLLDRNNRLKNNNTPINLYRNIQYKIELSMRKKSTEKLIDNNSKVILAKPSPIIQMDNNFRAKTAAYERVKRQLSRTNSFKSQLNTTKISMQQNEPVIELNNLDQNNFDQTKYVQYEDLDSLKQDSNSSTSNKSNDYESSNSHALEELEERIKKWHLDFGDKKARVATLNRIDIDKIKTDVRIGGNIFMRKHRLLNEPKNRHNKSTTSSYSETSSSETNNSENELDLGLSTLHRNMKPINRTESFRSPTNLNINGNNGFANSFYAYVENLDSNESSDSIEQNFENNNYRYLNNNRICSAIVQNKKILRRSSLVLHSSINTDNSSCSSSNQPKRRSLLPSRIDEDNASSDKSILIKLDSHQNKEKPVSLLYENSIENTDNSSYNTTTTNTNNNLSLIINKKNNDAHRLSASSNLNPYAVKRKYSLGPIKLQPTGKQFSKEDYETLRNELKKQTRRYSVNYN